MQEIAAPGFSALPHYPGPRYVATGVFPLSIGDSCFSPEGGLGCKPKSGLRRYVLTPGEFPDG